MSHDAHSSVGIILSASCTTILLASLIHSIFYFISPKKKRHVSNLLKKFAILSLLGYTLFVLNSLIFYTLHIESLQITFTTIICQLQTFNIVFFMLGKLSMYLFFMSLIHITFKGSCLAYPPKLLFFTSITFFLLMSVIGGFYMTFTYIDVDSVGSINSPSDCQQVTTSTYTTVTIWTLATCDGTWSFICLLLFYLRLRKLNIIMLQQTNLHKEQVAHRTATLHAVPSASTVVTTGPSDDDNIPAKTNLPQLVQSNSRQPFKSSNKSVTKSPSDEGTIEIVTISKNKQIKLKRKKSEITDVVKDMIPFLLKLTVLSTWCAFSTILLGFIAWDTHPVLSSVIDSAINGVCVYLSFSFSNNVYKIVCVPFIVLRYCKKCNLLYLSDK